MLNFMGGAIAGIKKVLYIGQGDRKHALIPGDACACSLLGRSECNHALIPGYAARMGSYRGM